MSAPSSSALANGLEDELITTATDKSNNSRGRGRGARGRDTRGGRGRGRGRGGGGANNNTNSNGIDDPHSAHTPTSPQAADSHTSPASAQSSAADSSASSLSNGDNSHRGRGGSSRGGARKGGGGNRGGRGGRRSSHPHRLKEVQAPDTQAWEQQCKQHQSSLNSLNQQIQQYTTQIESTVKQRKSLREHIKSLQSSLHAIQSDKQNLFEQYNRINEHIQDVESAHIQHKRELEQLKKELPYLTTQEVDAQIKLLDKQIISRTVVGEKAKEVVQEIQRLRTGRPRIFEYERKSKELSNVVDIDGFVVERETVHNQAYAKKHEEEIEQKKLDTAVVQEKQYTMKMEEWVAQRRTLLNQRQHMERDYSIQQDTYQAQHKAYDSYMKEKHYYEQRDSERKKQQQEYEARVARREYIAQQKAERAEREREWREQREAEEAAKDPYEEEKSIVVELLRYVNNLSLQYTEGDEDESASQQQQQEQQQEEEEKKRQELLQSRNTAFKGKSVVLKELEKTAAADKSPNSSHKKKHLKKQNKVLTHVPDVFHMFQLIEITPPMMSMEIDKTKVQLKEKQQYYETAPRPDKRKQKEKGKGGKEKKQNEQQQEAEEHQQETQEEEEHHEEPRVESHDHGKSHPQEEEREEEAEEEEPSASVDHANHQGDTAEEGGAHPTKWHDVEADEEEEEEEQDEPDTPTATLEAGPVIHH